MLMKCPPATRESRSQCYNVLQLGQPGLYFRKAGRSSYCSRCALGCAAILHHSSYFFSSFTTCLLFYMFRYLESLPTRIDPPPPPLAVSDPKASSLDTLP